MNAIKALNRWFDSLREPTRFIVFLCIVLLPILFASMPGLPAGIRYAGLLAIVLLIAARLIGWRK